MVSYADVLKTFEELSGWESLEFGVWNGKWEKEVSYDIEYAEYDTYQREQDYVFIVGSPDDLRINFKNAPEDGIITLDFIKECGKPCQYTDRKGVVRNYIKIPFGLMIHYIREIGDLPWENTIIVTNRSFV